MHGNVRQVVELFEVHAFRRSLRSAGCGGSDCFVGCGVAVVLVVVVGG